MFPYKRVTQACVPCRKKKTKCNGSKPTCHSCQKKELSCFYSEKRKRGRPCKTVGLENTSTFQEAHGCIPNNLSTSWNKNLGNKLQPLNDSYVNNFVLDLVDRSFQNTFFLEEEKVCTKKETQSIDIQYKNNKESATGEYHNIFYNEDKIHNVIQKSDPKVSIQDIEKSKREITTNNYGYNKSENFKSPEAHNFVLKNQKIKLHDYFSSLLT
ncbi:hypothetical protein BB559_002267 [Furculomyces boomerangus]|uniref:Zn(2)-C6 fungal-type domain-containing protein n=1 Tax=Furculomyces boomerangus TaxID=61424 RepID=A0A2T9YWP4_9FUNG|nr:hypothetical protein BB559_002267 [Furculomyces boomerangus]